MDGGTPDSSKLLQWRLECLGHSLIEGVAGLLPGPWVFRFGEALGKLAWQLLPQRRKMILRNLRIAFAGEKDLSELREMARETFLRTAANMVSVAHTAKLPPERLREVMEVENLGLLEQALNDGKGVVLLLSHMGNWELLSRLVHNFPKGTKTGAFYRPLNNRLMDERVRQRREADGTRMFSKRDPFHQVTGFLREGGVVGVLADQRVGRQGELVRFFGRVTRASPLPSLLARRSKSAVLALSMSTVAPGKWRTVFLPVETPYTTEHCTAAQEEAMKAGLLDVFWLQERWKVYVDPHYPWNRWIEDGVSDENKRHRVLLWLPGLPDIWRLPDDWLHPDVVYEAAIPAGQPCPSWLPDTMRVHEIQPTEDRDTLQKTIANIDAADALPLDFILTTEAPKLLLKAAKREAVPVISLP